jgi:hypothetical protein
VRAKTTIQDPPSSPPGGENNLERGDFPAPGEQTTGGGGVNHRSEPAPSSSIAGAKGVMGGGRGSSGKYDGCMSGGDTTKHRGCVGD